MGKFILGGISSSQLSTLVLDQKELVYDVDNNQIFYGDGTATGGLPLAGITGINASAGTTSNNLSNIVFSNSNGVSFGLNGSTVTASVSVTAAGDGINRISAGTQIAGTNQTVVFSNSNGITFGMSNNSVVTASHNGLTTAMASNAGSNFVNTSQSSLFQQVSNTSNITVNAVNITDARIRAIVDGAATISTGSVRFSNSNGITFGINGNTITASHNGITQQSTQPVAFSASNGSAQFETLYFSEGNGVTFSTDHIAGTDILKASVKTDYAGTQTGATNASITVNSNGVSVSVAPAGGNVVISAGGAFTSVSDFSFANGGGVSWGLNGSTITASVNAGGGANTISTYIPYYPASTGAQTLGAQGTSSASAWFFPVSVVQPVAMDRLEQLMTASLLSSSVSFQQTVTHQFGIFSNNAGTLSRISSSSYSVAITGSSVSHTLSCPVSYDTGGGYTYTTITATATNAAQSLFGTAGNRIMTFGFGNTMTLSEGLYWLGIHQRQSSSSANGGMAFALAGNVMAAPVNAGGLGSSTAAYTGTANTLYKIPWGVATSTGSAGYGGSVLPDAVNVTAMGMTVTVMPMMTFIDR